MIYGTKVKIINENKDRYPISAMCHILRISRSHYYTYKDDIEKVDSLAEKLKDIFRDNKRTYGRCKIKSGLERQAFQVSRSRIGRIIVSELLVVFFYRKS